MATKKESDRTRILLSRETAVIKHRDTTFSAPCRIYQSFTRLASVQAELLITRETRQLVGLEGEVDLAFPRSGMAFRGYVGGVEIVFRSVDQTRTVKQRIFPRSEPIIGKPSRNLVRVEFALANGARYFVERRINGKTLGELVLESDGWRVELRPLSALHQSVQKRLKTADTDLTHSGVLTRADGAQFRSKDAEEILMDVAQFLSFAAGWWVGVGLVRGVDSKGISRWKWWGFSRMEARGLGYSWYDWRLEDTIGDLFRGFVRRLRMPASSEALRNILYWYNRSNNRGAGVDGSIILSQAAFELLAWQVLVQDTALLSEDNFNSLKAEGQIRVLLGHLGIPLHIPLGLTELTKLGKEFNWTCGPQALVAIRNQLVHPAKTRRKVGRQSGILYHESWLLGQHLLELCILRLCGHQGTYVDRTKMHVIPAPELVPWVNNSRSPAE